MATILSPDTQLSSFEDAKLLKLLAHASGTVRARAIPTIGARIATNDSLKEALFTSSADSQNLVLVFYGFIKVAWIAAITVLDYGTKNDFLRLHDIIELWPQSERESFLSYIKDYRNFKELFSKAHNIK